jgi:hypothetical protein
MRSKGIEVNCRWLWTALLVVSISLFSLHAYAACAVDESQSYFFGTIDGVKFKERYELRAYIEGFLVGTTNANPGRFEEVGGRITFGLYVCSPQSDYGKTVEFRFLRMRDAKEGDQEYEVRVDEGDPTFIGKPIDFLGGIPTTPDSAKMKLVVTGKRVVIATDVDQSDDGNDGNDGTDGTGGDGGVPSGDATQVVVADPDVNNDSVVDSIDAAIVLNYILFDSNSDTTPNLRYDLNNDGVVSTEDVKEIYRRR